MSIKTFINTGKLGELSSHQCKSITRQQEPEELTQDRSQDPTPWL